MAKKRSFLSSLFGGKKDDVAQVAQQETSNEEEQLAAEQEEQNGEASPHSEEPRPNASSSAADLSEASDELTSEREGTDLPSAVDDAAAVQSKTALSAETALSEKAALSAETALSEKTALSAETALSEKTAPSESQPQSTAERPEKQGWWQRLRDGLKKTSSTLGSGLADLFVGKQIDDELFEDLETQLLMADVGVETTANIIAELTSHASRKELKDAELLFARLKEYMAEMLTPVSTPLTIDNSNGPFVILMVGVNGVGKTTTIGKLARQFQSEGKSVMLAAGDTFRAAAVEQLQVWGERNDIPVIAQHTGADSASVIFDAVQAAKARGVDILIADTAGRLQNKANLMEELKKIVRVMKKQGEHMPHEVLLTLDAGTGQNAISQAKIFNEAVGVTGLAMTKLDGTAKGGVIFALANQFKIPIRYIGVGESLNDLRPFVANEFVDALFTDVTGSSAEAGK